MSGMCMVPVGLLTQATQSAEESGDSLNSQQQIWLSAFNISRKWACDIIWSVFRTRTWKRSLQEVVCLCVWGRVHAVVWHLPRITTGWRNKLSGGCHGRHSYSYLIMQLFTSFSVRVVLGHLYSAGCLTTDNVCSNTSTTNVFDYWHYRCHTMNCSSSGPAWPPVEDPGINWISKGLSGLGAAI